MLIVCHIVVFLIPALFFPWTKVCNNVYWQIIIFIDLQLVKNTCLDQTNRSQTFEKGVDLFAKYKKQLTFCKNILSFDCMAVLN